MHICCLLTETIQHKHEFGLLSSTAPPLSCSHILLMFNKHPKTHIYIFISYTIEQDGSTDVNSDLGD